MADPLTYELRGTVALLRLDDGKANAITHGVLESIHAALDRAREEATAVVFAGRTGRFSAGFDLGTFAKGPAAAGDLVRAGGRLALEIYGHPLPIVAACTGHAIAMGAILLLASDVRIGTAGAFKIGLNEVAIGLTLPRFGLELARDRLTPRHLTSAVALGRMYDPEAACHAGYLDRLVDPELLITEAVEEATRLSALKQPAFGNTKRRLRAPTIDLVASTLDEDIRGLTGG